MPFLENPPLANREILLVGELAPHDFEWVKNRDICSAAGHDLLYANFASRIEMKAHNPWDSKAQTGLPAEYYPHEISAFIAIREKVAAHLNNGICGPFAVLEVTDFNLVGISVILLDARDRKLFQLLFASEFEEDASAVELNFKILRAQSLARDFKYSDPSLARLMEKMRAVAFDTGKGMNNLELDAAMAEIWPEPKAYQAQLQEALAAYREYGIDEKPSAVLPATEPVLAATPARNPYQFGGRRGQAKRRRAPGEF